MICCRWVFRLQEQKFGEDVRFKARLVARGFEQTNGIDYDETFASVVRYESVRTMLAMDAAEDLDVAQFDVETAFLHPVLEEEVYMSLPDGLDVSGDVGGAEPCPGAMQTGTKAGGTVYRLIKAMYGLKQAPRRWFETFVKHLQGLGFQATTADTCVFISHKYNCLIFILFFLVILLDYL